jgi:hypothetical protein
MGVHLGDAWELVSIADRRAFFVGRIFLSPF